MWMCGPAFFYTPEQTHRYWGIRFNANSVAGSSLGYGDCSFHAVDGGPNLAAGKVLQTTGQFLFSQNNAFDGMIGDRANGNGTYDGVNHNVAHSNATFPVIDYVDFGAGAPVAVNQFRLVAADTAYLALMPGNFDIVCSDDALTWTTAWSVTGQTDWTQAEIRTFTNPQYSRPSYTGSKYGAHKYWRLVLFGVGTVATNNAYSMAELQMRATPTGANQCMGGSASAGQTWPEFTPAMAFDGNANTAWGSTSVTLSNWLQYTFPSPVSVGAVAITARNDGAGYGQTPVNFTVEFSDDGTNWHLGWHVLTTNWALGEQRVFTDPDFV
jgi:hypothetical protein